MELGASFAVSRRPEPEWDTSTPSFSDRRSSLSGGVGRTFDAHALQHVPAMGIAPTSLLNIFAALLEARGR